jgi:alpha-N-arabinofuranosidase
MVSQFNFFDQLTLLNQTLLGESAVVHPNGGIAWSGPLQPYPWWGGAVAEAVYLLAAERNSNRIIGAMYVSNNHFRFIPSPTA